MYFSNKKSLEKQIEKKCCLCSKTTQKLDILEVYVPQTDVEEKLSASWPWSVDYAGDYPGVHNWTLGGGIPALVEAIADGKSWDIYASWDEWAHGDEDDEEEEQQVFFMVCLVCLEKHGVEIIVKSHDFTPKVREETLRILREKHAAYIATLLQCYHCGEKTELTEPNCFREPTRPDWANVDTGDEVLYTQDLAAAGKVVCGECMEKICTEPPFHPDSDACTMHKDGKICAADAFCSGPYGVAHAGYESHYDLTTFHVTDMEGEQVSGFVAVCDGCLDRALEHKETLEDENGNPLKIEDSAEIY